MASQPTNQSIYSARSMTRRQQTRVDRLDSALRRAPRLREPITVYRGERHPRLTWKHGSSMRTWPDGPIPDTHDGLLGWAQSQWMTGSQVQFSGFSSWTASPRTAMLFTCYEADRPAMLFRTRTRYFGHPGCAHVPAILPEHDLITPRGTCGEVLGANLERMILPPWWKRPIVGSIRARAQQVFVVVDVELDV